MTHRNDNLRIVMDHFGGPEVLRARREPIPEPGHGEVRVRVLAASAQFTDTMIRRGNYPLLPSRPPFSPGYDFVGEVDAVGAGVTRFDVGQRVADLTILGSYASYVVRPAASVVPVPDGVDAAEAAALVLSWVTAYQMLHRVARAEAGQRVLVTGGAGAVGNALIQLAQLRGVDVIALARPEHHPQLRAQGAESIDYRGDWAARVRELTGGAGVDVVFDGVGERGFRTSWSVVKRGGRLIAFGFQRVATGEAGRLEVPLAYLRQVLYNLWPNGKKAALYSITDWRKDHPEHFTEDLSALFELLRRRAITPRVEARMPLSDAAEAHRRIEAGGLTGKLVLVPAA